MRFPQKLPRARIFGRRSPRQLPMLALVTITYRQPNRLRATLADLLAQDYPHDRLNAVVLDDGSGDETAGILEAFRAEAPFPVTMLETEHERDYLNARRWNQCLAACRAPTDAFVQIDDVRLRPDFLRQHAKWHVEGSLRLVTGAKLEGPTAQPIWDLGLCKRHPISRDGSPAPCPWLAVWGASMSFTRRLVELVREPPHDNPYDERMVGWGWHEVELAYRMQKAGAEVFYDPTAGVYHPAHDPARDAADRRIDRLDAVSAGYEQNEQYVRAKHGITTLPWWPT